MPPGSPGAICPTWAHALIPARLRAHDLGVVPTAKAPLPSRAGPLEFVPLRVLPENKPRIAREGDQRAHHRTDDHGLKRRGKRPEYISPGRTTTPVPMAIFRPSKRPTRYTQFWPRQRRSVTASGSSARPHEGGVGLPGRRSDRLGHRHGQKQNYRRSLQYRRRPRAIAGWRPGYRAIHHFVDYNWNPDRGSPRLVTESASDVLAKSPEAQVHLRRYVRNFAFWLAGLPLDAEREAPRLDEELEEALEESFPANDPRSVI